MPPLTRVCERWAPRATWSCIDEPLKPPGRSRSASLHTPVKGQAWRHRLLRAPGMSNVPATPPCLKLPGMLDEPLGSLPLTGSVELSANGMSSGRPLWKPKHFALGRRIFERTILPIAMTLVKFWIVEDRVWWDLSWWDLAQDLCVLFQQGIDHLGHLARNANQDLEFPAIGSFSLVIPAHPGNQALVEFGPCALLSLDRIGDDQEHGLLHRPCPRVSQLIAVEGRSALLSLWSPSKVGFEGGSVLKVEDIIKDGVYSSRGGIDRPPRRL